MDFQDLQVSSLSDTRKPVISRNNFFIDTDLDKKEKEDQASPKPGSAFVGVMYNSAILGENLQPNALASPSSSHASILNREGVSPFKIGTAEHIKTKEPAVTETKIEYEFDYKQSDRPKNYCPPLMAHDSEASGGMRASQQSNLQADDANDASEALIKDLSQAQAEAEIEEQEHEKQEKVIQYKQNNSSQESAEKEEESLLFQEDDAPMESSRVSAAAAKSRSSSMSGNDFRAGRPNDEKEKEERDVLMNNVSEALSSHQAEHTSQVLSESGRNLDKNPEEDDGSQAQPPEYNIMMQRRRKNAGNRLKNFSHVVEKNEYNKVTDFYKNASHVVIKKNAIAPMITSTVPPNLVSQGRVIDLKSPQPPLQTGLEIRAKNEYEKEQTGFEKLESMEGLVLKQKFHVFKDEAGWQPPYRTYIHSYLPFEGETGKKMFQCNEMATCCARQCMSNFCRPFSVVVNKCNPGESPDNHKPFLLLERLCSCSCLWLNRPKISVQWIEDGRNEFLGTIQDSFDWGSIKLDIFDREGKLKYVLQGSCCQWGLICNCYCKACQQVKFLVQPTFPGKFLEVTKTNTNYSKESFPNADRFNLEFSSTSSPEDRALLLSAMLFLESRHFEGDA